jgi:hypothetical protein
MNGDDLVTEVLRNMEEGQFRIRGKTVVPSIYRIYVNNRDFEPFRHVVPFIAGEIRAALDHRLAQWNAAKPSAAALLRRVARRPEPETEAPFTRLADAWTVEIYPDLDGQLSPGEIEVHSELGAPARIDHGVGALTRRIFPKGAEPAPSEPTAAGPTPESFEAPETDATVRTSALPPDPEPAEIDRTAARAFAYIRYADQHGPQTFEMTKSQMVIGRGGRSYWVDLRLETLPDVSREHCRIRRDSETGRFTIEDVSQFGTAVNGKPVGQNAVAELPRRATISLAGVIDLQWETA